VEFQNTGTTPTSLGIHEICKKSGHGEEWAKIKESPYQRFFSLLNDKSFVLKAFFLSSLV
jgi:hypothetical protein